MKKRMGKNFNRRYSKIETLEELYREQVIMDRMLDEKEEELYVDYSDIKSFFSLSGVVGLVANGLLGRSNRRSTSFGLAGASTLLRGVTLGYQIMRLFIPRKKR